MDQKNKFWKNFNMGSELDIAGTFIYNGLYSFSLMDNFRYESEAFEVLYNISVGIERLIKINIILIENVNPAEQEIFEGELKTHNHVELFERIQNERDIKLKKPAKAFLSLLSKFYKTWRYDRYIMDSAYDYKKERDGLISYLKKHAGNIVEHDEVFDVTRNNEKIKNFFCKQVTTISRILYESIGKEARRLNIYTYELRYDSKAAKIFMGNDFGFVNENIALNELLVYLMNTKDQRLFYRVISDIKPLDFDYGRMGEYIEAIKKPLKRADIYDEVEALYEEIDNVKERIEHIKAFDYADHIIGSEDEIDEE